METLSFIGIRLCFHSGNRKQSDSPSRDQRNRVNLVQRYNEVGSVRGLMSSFLRQKSILFRSPVRKICKLLMTWFKTHWRNIFFQILMFSKNKTVKHKLFLSVTFEHDNPFRSFFFQNYSHTIVRFCYLVQNKDNFVLDDYFLKQNVWD